MTANWASCTILALCMMFAGAGCRTTQPNLKPPETAERLVEPPSRLETPGYPKLAFDTPDDQARKVLDIRAAGGVPARNMMQGGPGMSGMGGAGGMTGGGY